MVGSTILLEETWKYAQILYWISHQLSPRPNDACSINKERVSKHDRLFCMERR